jgi:hypothetical protein
VVGDVEGVIGGDPGAAGEGRGGLRHDGVLLEGSSRVAMRLLIEVM